MADQPPGTAGFVTAIERGVPDIHVLLQSKGNQPTSPLTSPPSGHPTPTCGVPSRLGPLAPWPAHTVIHWGAFLHLPTQPSPTPDFGRPGLPRALETADGKLHEHSRTYNAFVRGPRNCGLVGPSFHVGRHLFNPDCTKDRLQFLFVLHNSL